MSERRNVVIVVGVVIVLIAAAFFLFQCSDDAEDSTTITETEESAQAEPEEPTEQTPVVPEEDSLYYTPTYKPNGSEIAVVSTPKGEIKFEFYPEDAPNHVAAFIELSQKGFYDGTTFHRVEPNFVIQGGDPNTKTGEGAPGTGGPGYNLEAEFNSRQHLDGTVSMARSTDPNSAGSQFYICMGPQPFLDGQYTVFGQVTEGLDVVYSIGVGDVMESLFIENANE